MTYDFFVLLCRAFRWCEDQDTVRGNCQMSNSKWISLIFVQHADPFKDISTKAEARIMI